MPQSLSEDENDHPDVSNVSYRSCSTAAGFSINSVSAMSTFMTSRPTRESVLQRLSEALLRRSLIKIDLSQRGLRPADARLVKMALLQNAHVSVLKLGYNNLGDEGVAILAPGLSQHPALESLDLGFNNIGDEGCAALAAAVPAHLHTLYLAGNLIGQDGAFSLADLIRRTGALRRLYLTGDKIGVEGVCAITNAIQECEQQHHNYEQEEKDDRQHERSSNDSHCGAGGGMEELFLGGTDMGSIGCQAIAGLLGSSTNLRVLSLPNCDLDDDCIGYLASNIKASRQTLPLACLELSFNRLSCRGIELLSNAVWGSSTLKELRLDNNRIADMGAHHIAGVLPTLLALESLDLGFNSIKTRGMMSLMKAVADSPTLKSLSVSGNAIDANGAKAITYALAYSQSLTSLSLVRCEIKQEGQRQIVAGIVCNSRTALRAISGFAVGPVVVSLGFPAPLEHWTNEQVFNFIHLMWAKNGSEILSSEEEKNSDPLHFLGGVNNHRPAPLEASVVVELSKKTFAMLVEDGVDVFSRLPGHRSEMSELSSPIAGDNIVYESVTINGSNVSLASQRKNKSFVAPPEATKSTTPDPARKKRIVEWLCRNIQHLNRIAQQPFSSSELGRLHQHYFTPVVNESGGCMSSDQGGCEASMTSLPAVSIASGDLRTDTSNDSIDSCIVGCGQNSSMRPPLAPSGIASLSMLKRKVSYRFLGDAAMSSAPKLESARCGHGPVTMLIEGGAVGQTLPRTTKRARRNRSRISFLPRIKVKLDSYLDVCHEKALTTMRQLYFVERAILAGQVNPIDPNTTARTHLCGDFATDAETIIVDMI